MKRTRRIAAGLCVLLLAQTCIPAGAAQGEPEAAATETSAAETTIAETKIKETAIKETATTETSASEEKETAAVTEKNRKNSLVSMTQKTSADEKTGMLEYEIQIKNAAEELIFSAEIPEGYEVKTAFQSAGGEAETKLHPGTDWEQQEGRFTCSVQPDRERTIRLVCGLTDQKRTEYAGLEEGLELELSGKAVLSDSDGNVQKELAFSKKKIELPPFIRKEAEALERNQSRYQWTDWLNLGFESGSGYLVEVIDDLGAQYPVGERENLEVTLLSQDGEELERIPVTQIQPENPKAFGEIFNGEDIEEYLADASGAVFYIAETSGTETEPVRGRKADAGEAETEDEEEATQTGILVVPIDSLAEPVGVAYQTRVSAADREDTYDWEADLKTGSRFLWNLEPEADRKEGAEPEQEEEKAKEAHPDWERKAERIPEMEKESRKSESDDCFSAVQWSEVTSTGRLVAQEPAEDGYDDQSGEAFWDVVVNQNGEDVRETVITRELPADEQSFAGALSEGNPISVMLYDGDSRESDRGKKAEIPVFEEKSMEIPEEADEFYGYYVLEQDEEKGKTNRLEIHLFQLGRNRLEFRIETLVKDTVFADAGEEGLISSGKTEYTAVLAEAETEPENDAETEREPKAETETERETDAKTEREPKAETENEQEAETEPETDAEAESEPEQKPDAETEQESTAETETDAETESEAEPEPKAETETEQEQEAETEPETETERPVKQISGSCETAIPVENQWLLVNSSADASNHEIQWEVTVNPKHHFLWNPKLTMSLPAGLEQVTLKQVMVEGADGRKQDITDEERITVKETAAGKKKKDRKAVFTWENPEDEDCGAYQLTFTCAVSEKLRKEAVLADGSFERVCLLELDGFAGTKEEHRQISSASKEISHAFSTMAVNASGTLRSDRYKLEGSKWNGMQMPRVDWNLLVNQAEADLSDSGLKVEWPEEMRIEPESLRIYLAEQKPDGTMSSRKTLIWPEEEAIEETEKEAEKPEAEETSETEETEETEEETSETEETKETEEETSEIEEAEKTKEETSELKETENTKEKASETEETKETEEETSEIEETKETEEETSETEDTEETPKEEPLWDGVQLADDSLEITLSETVGKQILSVEFCTFAVSDMEKGGCSGWYQFTQGKKVLEDGSMEVSPTERISIAEAAEKNPIPSVLLSVFSENSEAGKPYYLDGAEYGLTRMELEEDGEETSWDSYKKAEETETAVSGAGGTAAFLFVEPDVLYCLEELEPAVGYAGWDGPKYLVILDEKEKTDFPESDEEHEQVTGTDRICLEQEAALRSTEGAEAEEDDSEAEVPDEAEAPDETKASDEATEADEAKEAKASDKAEKGGRLEFRIQDQDGQLLEGAECSLTYVDYKNSGNGSLKAQTAVSDEEGLVVFRNLDPLSEGQEGYEIHVTAPYGLEDPAEFSAAVTARKDGDFETALEGKVVEQKSDGAYITCAPMTADVKIPVTDQNGNLLKECGLELQVERLEEPEEKEETEFLLYNNCPSVKEDGSGYINLTDFPYGTYRLSGGTSILTLIIDEKGAAGELEAVERENEIEDKASVKVKLTADSQGIYHAEEADGWYLEEWLPRAEVSFTLADAQKPEMAVSGARFMVFETWSDRLVGELKEDGNGTYTLSPESDEEAENDRGYEYLRDYDGAYRLLPGTYAVWETEAAEGYQPEGEGVWYFTIGDGTDAVGNDDLTAGDGSRKEFVNSIIRSDVPVHVVPEKDEQDEQKKESVTLFLEGFSWTASEEEENFEEKITCEIGEVAVFEQVPVGIYTLYAETGKKSSRKASGRIQVQVRYDGAVQFFTIGGRELEQAEIMLR